MNLAILVGRKYYLIGGFVCISLMANDVVHLFMYILPRELSVENLSPYLIGLFQIIDLKLFLYIPDNKPYQI